MTHLLTSCSWGFLYCRSLKGSHNLLFRAQPRPFVVCGSFYISALREKLSRTSFHSFLLWCSRRQVSERWTKQDKSMCMTGYKLVYSKHSMQLLNRPMRNVLVQSIDSFLVQSTKFTIAQHQMQVDFPFCQETMQEYPSHQPFLIPSSPDINVLSWPLVSHSDAQGISFARWVKTLKVRLSVLASNAKG